MSEIEGDATRRSVSLAAVVLAGAALTLGPPVTAAADGTCSRSDRPSIGLALSGGGARGGAHIGVLAALEELRVPVDCIAGTSVGAAVGGFYSAGLAVDDIDTIVRNIDWEAALSNATSRHDRSLRRKQDDFLFLLSLRPGLRSGHFSLPIGINQGQVIDTIISRTLAGQQTARDFDQLPTPFRAVATDIATGNAVVLAAGDLGLALRASMSLPAVLAPIDIDGRMLVDGGLAMNLPVEVVQSMGADVVVAVDATSALLGRDALNSVVDVTSQVTTLMTRPAMEAQRALLDETDVLLEPVFDTRTTFTSFATFADTIDDGYRAVMDQRERFAQWSLDAEGYAAHIAARQRRTVPEVISFVRVDNRSSIADSVIQARIGRIPLDAPLDLAAIEAAVGRVYGLQLFQNVRYSVTTDETGATGVEIRVDERAWGPSYLQLGLHYTSSSADSTFGLVASYLRTGINELGGEWRGTVAVGDEPGASVDFYQPLGRKANFFVEPQIGAKSTVFDVFANGLVSTSFEVRETALELGAGRSFGETAELRAGVRTAEGDYRLRIGNPALLPADRFRHRDAFVRFQADELDSVAFPRAGYSATAEWSSSRASRPAPSGKTDQLSIRAQAARTWGRQTLLATLRYDVTSSGEAPPYAQFRLGGFRDLAGLSRNELTGQNAARVGLSWYRRIGDIAIFPAFAGVTLERGNVWSDRRAIGYRDAIAAAALWAGISTPIGPVYLGAGRTADGRDAVYFSLGGAF